MEVQLTHRKVLRYLDFRCSSVAFKTSCAVGFSKVLKDFFFFFLFLLFSFIEV